MEGSTLTTLFHFILLNSQVNRSISTPGISAISKGPPIIIIYQPFKIPVINQRIEKDT